MTDAVKNTETIKDNAQEETFKEIILKIRVGDGINKDYINFPKGEEALEKFRNQYRKDITPQDISLLTMLSELIEGRVTTVLELMANFIVKDEVKTEIGNSMVISNYRNVNRPQDRVEIIFNGFDIPENVEEKKEEDK